MYAVAQHVRQAPASGNDQTRAEGINSFLSESRVPFGKILHQQSDVVPAGNNSVESYLEVDYASGVTQSQLDALLVALSIAVGQGMTTTTVEQQGVGRAEFMFLEKHRARSRDEWELLKRRLLAEVRL